jgi:hypothetical protein
MSNIISSLPFTLTNGQPNDASQVMANLNQIRNDVNNNAQSANAPAAAYLGAVVTFATTQNTTEPTAYTVAFTAENIDTSSIHSTSVNNSRLTVPAAVSKVKLTANIFTSTSPNCAFGIYKNGTDLIAIGKPFGATGGYGVTIDTCTQVVSPGDYFEIITFGGGSLNYNIYGTTAGKPTTFEMQILG